ncbi:translation initiation factor IF-2 [Candidatus Dependentiae bacterium]|nr:translation initiation factor IF-2 [Candidatus Dependentiae bacterium]MBU4386863.1 translation initiation factor IF-2 [Candidatus Dependentiae bacterium]MCG2756472.1 translation initiation factor IF-2 [Candidatus Dependentiae bacterium]
MRIYEFAKEKNLSSKEILEVLKSNGYEFASHMSVISDQALVFLNKKYSKDAKTSIEKSPEKNVVKDVVTEKKPEVKIIKKEKDLRASKSDTEVIEEKTAVQITEDKKIFNTSTHKKNNEERRIVTEIILTDSMPLHQAANLMGKSDGELIFALLKKGSICNRNNIIPIDTIKSLAQDFGIKVEIKNISQDLEKFLPKNKTGAFRWPIVVVMGHVDHGKTTLLDFLRKQNVAAKEKGGITQHLGAYEVESKHGKIIFLDTPGHEAFTYIRSRGANVTDLAVLVISAEDGIKPQTIECIKHAKQAQVPIIVAVNKIDKISPERLDPVMQSIKRDLAAKDILVEDWGGDVICLPISAKTGAGVDELLEMIILQSELMDLKSDKNLPAKSFVLESNLERGLGPVATVITLEGTLRIGDYFTCGNSTGRVRVLVDSYGNRLKEALPSIPVKVIGFDNFAEIGGWLKVVPFDEYKKAKFSTKAIVQSPSMDFSIALMNQDKKSINLIIKTDTRGSKEAIEGSIEKLAKLTEKDCSSINIIYSSIGDVSESDIERASDSNSMILTLHAKIDKKAMILAQEKNVKVHNFDIIYHLVEFLEAELKKTKKIVTRWVPKAKLLVKKVFDLKKLGIIAGCSVQEGVVANGNKVVCMRAGRNVGEGIIKSLQKDRKVVKEVHAGYECGFVSDNFQDWAEDDLVNVFAEEKVVGE